LAIARLEYEERRVTGYIHVSWLDPDKVRRVTVVGSGKMAVYNDMIEERLRIFDRGVERQHPERPLHEQPLSYRYGDIVSPHIPLAEPLAIEDTHFVDCIYTVACRMRMAGTAFRWSPCSKRSISRCAPGKR
jgi:hypothetical protein